MSMKNQVLTELKSAGFTDEWILEHKMGNLDCVSFFEQTEDNKLLKVTLLFIEEIKRVQVDIGIKINGLDEVSCLRKINDFNIEHLGRQFYLLNDEMFVRGHIAYNDNAAKILEFANLILSTADKTIAKVV